MFLRQCIYYLFKGYIRKLSTSKLQGDLKNLSTFKAIAPNREEILFFIIKGWYYLNKDTTTNGFVKANLINYLITDKALPYKRQFRQKKNTYCRL